VRRFRHRNHKLLFNPNHDEKEYETMFDLDFPKADPVPRGCGDREPGGVYAESGLSPWGRPLEEFLIDPPLPIPEGLDLVNKPQLWQRMLSSGEPALDEEGLPIYDLLIWVGGEFYPYCCDYLEEARRYGASRRLNPNLDLSLLSRSSRMILAHPLVLNTAWRTQRPPQACKKEIPGHDVAVSDDVDVMGETVEEAITSSLVHPAVTSTEPRLPALLSEFPQTGPCLFKLWELIPQEAAQTVIDISDGEAGEEPPGAKSLPLCLRTIGSTTYQYRPTGESADGLLPGIFAALPITGFALIRDLDGSVNDRAKEKILAGLEAHGSSALPVYETDQ
jgi:hypothetical protein